MKRSEWQYLIDTLLFIFMMGIVLIGLLLGLLIPEGPSVAENSKYFLGLHRHAWAHIHFYLSIAFIILLLIHLMFSWKWIKNKAKHIFKNAWRTSLILTLFFALLAPLLIWNFWPKYAETYADYGYRQRNSDVVSGGQESNLPQEGEEYIVVTGQMTLADLEKATGISPQAVIEKLDLPKRTKQDETMGQLRKKYGLDLQDVRDIITTQTAVPTETPKNKEKIPEERVSVKIPEKQVTTKDVKAEETEHEDKITRGRLAEDPSGLLITGQMTLRDIEKQTGIQARTLATKLGLPSTTPLNERIGRLRRLYQISIQDVRDTVSACLKESQEKGIS